ncbi:MAG: hypothetical protein A2Y71_09705 [Bacteroidetes bacterium RBG_13_42_15]|nr:MAG: hypothetical protein A2Y71_09705 [Bacteroidetes bacterium RBG_13_42_15]
MGEFHFSVKKKVIDGRTQTMISALNEAERIGEIAYLIGGDQVTESVVQSARELIQLKDIENDSDG